MTNTSEYDYDEALFEAHAILAPIVGAIRTGPDTVLGEQIDGWVNTELNNSWTENLAPDVWAQRVADRFGWEI